MAPAKQPMSSEENLNEQAVSRLYRVALEQQPAAGAGQPQGPVAPGAPAQSAQPAGASRPRAVRRRIDIKEEIARRERIRNDEAEQDIRLKRTTLQRLFIFLALETIVVFAFALMQAINAPFNFSLEEWSFKLLITVTIAQITAMLFVAVNHLFPKNRQK